MARFSNLSGCFSLSRRNIVGLLGVLLMSALGWRHYCATRPEALLHSGREALRNNDVAGAWESVAALEERDHIDASRLLRGEIFHQSGRRSEALEVLAALDEQSPYHVPAVALSARCLLELGATLKAERLYHYLLSRSPDSPEAVRGLAATYFDLGALPQAAHLCRRWAELEPERAAPHRFLGVILKELFRFPDAIDAYQTALSLGLPADQTEQVLIDLAQCQVNAKRFDDALATLDRLGSVSHGKLTVVDMRADALRGLSRAAEAADLLDNTLREHPHHVHALRLRGLLYLDEGRPDLSVSFLERAAKLAPRTHAVRVNLAQAYAAAGKDAAAKREQERAQELEKILRELSQLTAELPKDFRNPRLHERIAALYSQVRLDAPAARYRQLAEMLRDTARLTEAGSPQN
jgi:tetratricopeptide (TPR) repeat protein